MGDGQQSAEDGQDQKDKAPEIDRRRKALRDFLISSLIGVEQLLSNCRHFFLIPETSVIDKLPYFRTAFDNPSTVLLSSSLRESLKYKRIEKERKEAAAAGQGGQQGGPQNEATTQQAVQVHERRRPKFLVTYSPGVEAIVAANVLLLWVLARAGE